MTHSERSKEGIIDFSSDAVTEPVPAMRKAMAEAELTTEENPMKKRTLSSLMIASLFLFTFSSIALAAEKYPAREVQVVTSNPPGGMVDLTIPSNKSQ